MNKLSLALAGITLLAGCVHVPEPPAPQPARADIILSTEAGIGAVVFDARHAYLALGATGSAGSSVIATGTVISRASRWTQVEMAHCALGPAPPGQALRVPQLRRLNGSIYLFQQTGGAGEHALCQLERGSARFAARDAGLGRRPMTDLQTYGGQLFSNAGGAGNVLASADAGASWRALREPASRSGCAPAPFRIVGNRLLLGGHCPAGSAALHAYPMAQDGLHLASSDPLPIALPELEERDVRFIRPVGDDGTVFVGVEGGLLRSTDQGRSFEFVFQYRLGGARYPVIGHLLALRNRPDVMLIGGVDRAGGKPFLAVTRDGGAKWSELSALLPGYAASAEVTGLVQDPAGRILVSLNLDQGSTGRLVLLSLGSSG